MLTGLQGFYFCDAKKKIEAEVFCAPCLTSVSLTQWMVPERAAEPWRICDFCQDYKLVYTVPLVSYEVYWCLGQEKVDVGLWLMACLFFFLTNHALHMNDCPYNQV